MRVIIDKQVDVSISEFYAVSMVLHPSLDRETVRKKVNRLYDAIQMLGLFPGIYPMAQVKQGWIDAGYREMIAEDFHFAFRVENTESGEQVVAVYDAVHSLLNHN